MKGTKIIIGEGPAESTVRDPHQIWANILATNREAFTANTNDFPHTWLKEKIGEKGDSIGAKEILNGTQTFVHEDKLTNLWIKSLKKPKMKMQ